MSNTIPDQGPEPFSQEFIELQKNGLTVEQLIRIKRLLRQTRGAVLNETPPPDEDALLREEIGRRLERARIEIQPEPPPQNGEGGDVWADVINEEMSVTALLYCIARRQQGIDKYGVPLAPHNGRAAWRDMLQEALDAQAYAEQELQQTRALHAGLPDIPIEKMPLQQALDATDIYLMMSIGEDAKASLRKALEDCAFLAHIHHRFNERKNRNQT